MSTSQQQYSLMAAARVFALVAVGVPQLWYRNSEGLLAVLALGVLWAYQVAVAHRRAVHLQLPPAVEACAVGLVCALAMSQTPTVLAVLVVPPFIAMMGGDLRTMLGTVVAQLTMTLGFGFLWSQVLTPEQVIGAATWTAAGLGLSLIANAAGAAADERRDPLEPYRDAQDLIRQLIDISGELSSGLDVGTLSGEILSAVNDELPTKTLALYVSRGETLTPVFTSAASTEQDLTGCETLAIEAWASAEPISDGRAFAFPAGTAVVAGVLPDNLTATRAGTEAIPYDRLSGLLQPLAVKLDTALLFAQFRDSATSDERRRLAREMHDGVAQDIASLGYLVDALASRPADEAQAKAFGMLRTRITGIVAEVRQSVLTLRTSMGESESLGQAISAISRHLSEASGVPIQVRLDEQPTRLRAEVEAELFRIAQEALNNAVKHARATAIEVNCQVYAPEARLTISDDGLGLQAARADSHGLKIMRERAKLIGADLKVRNNAGRGLTVAVTIRQAGRPALDSSGGSVSPLASPPSDPGTDTPASALRSLPWRQKVAR